MTQPVLDPTLCPSCLMQHGGTGRCVRCGLPLTGPLAIELWQVDTSIVALRGRRTELIAALRLEAGDTAPAPAPAGSWPAEAGTVGLGTAGLELVQPAPPSAGHPFRPLPARERTEWTPKRVQNTLLGLGVLLLAVAAVIFTVVTWGSLGIGARAAILATVTAAAAAVAPVALRRSLPATAEAFAALAVLLLVIDAYGAWRSLPGLQAIDGRLYSASAAAVIAALCALYAGLVPLRTPRIATAAAALLPVPLLAAWTEDVAIAALLLITQAALSAAVATLRRPGDDAARVLRVGAIGAGVVGAGLAAVQAFPAEPVGTEILPGAALLVLAGAVSVLTGWLRRETRTMVLLAGGRTAGALILAVVAVARLSVEPASLPAVLALAGLAAVAMSLLLRDWERGPLVVGAATVGLALLVDGAIAALAVVAPFAWLENVWGLTDVSVAAGRAVPDADVWPGTATALVTLAAAAVTAWLLGRRTGRVHAGLLGAGGLLVLAATTAPVALGWTYAVAVGWLAATGVAVLTAAWALARSQRLALIVALPGAALLAFAVVWSLANEPATVIVLGVVAVALAGLTTRSLFRLAAGTGAAAVALGWVFAVARSIGADVPASGFALALAACAVVGVAFLFRRDQLTRTSLELTGATAYATALLLALENIDWTSGVLAAGVLTAAALAFDPARRDAAAVSGALAAGLAWTATAALDGSIAQRGLAVAVTGCALAGVAWLLRAHRGDSVEAVALATYGIGVVAAGLEADALSLALAVGGVTALAVALRRDRRSVAYLGAALLTGCLWVRLAAAGVSAPEPYVLPPALAALVLGHLRRVADTRVGSWPAYGPGLALALLPTLYVILSDPGLARPLALGALALAACLLGVRDRLQAPIVLGGATLAIDAIIQIAPYAAALPRWVGIGSAGLLLVVVGATYEQRLRDVRRLQSRFDALA